MVYENFRVSEDAKPEENRDFKNIERSEEGPLLSIDQIESGKPASFLVYHGSSRPFIEAVPDEEHKMVFYADTPEVAATYPWGLYQNSFPIAAQKLYEKYPDSSVVIGAKLLHTRDLESTPDGKKMISSHKLYNLNDPEIVKIDERLRTDNEFRADSERLLYLWESEWDSYKVKKNEVVDYENGPMGSVREYLASAKNPIVYDFQNHTWGDFPDEEHLGQWLTPTKRATTEWLRERWNAWLNAFFENGHDVVIVKNIRDVGSNIDYKAADPHTIIAASPKTKIEVKALHTPK